jgi:hypothetical protein
VRKWSRRHPSVVVAGVLLLTVCLVGLSISNRLIAREQQKTANALDREKDSNRLLAQEQQKTADALDREKERANEAEEMFRQARQAVDVLVEVSEDELADNFHMVQTRKRLLQTALGFYQDFVEQRRGDAASQADLATVEQRVKGILDELELLRRDMQTMLLRKPVVLRELRLNEQQDKQIAELVRQWNEEREILHTELDSLDEESLRHRLVALAEKREHLFTQLLSDEQGRRLGQLLLQWQGFSAFKEPEVVAALELTREQRAAIRKIERELFGRGPERDRGFTPPERRGVPGERGVPDRGRHDQGPKEDKPHDRGLREQGGPDFRQAMSKVLALLNEEQIQRWRKLTGAAVEGLNEPPFGGLKRTHDNRKQDDSKNDDRQRTEQEVNDREEK